MSLVIHLKPNEKILIGQAVVKNGDKHADFCIENKVPILREKDIMKNEAASTACRRLYFTIQLMYIDEENLETYQRSYLEITEHILAAAPSTRPFIETISEKMLNRDYYHALKDAKHLIEHENQLLEKAAARQTA